MAEERDKKKRKKGPKHPGVVFMKPDEARRIGWRARWVDPDTGKFVADSMPKDVTTQEQRWAWAVDKSKALAKRRLELDSGAVKATGSALKDTIKKYYDAHPHLRARTVEAYEAATDKLLAWATKDGIESGDAINRAKLLEFKGSLLHEKKRVPGQGKQGTYLYTDEPRSPGAVNRDLRSLRTVLGYLCDRDLFPKLNHGDLRRVLKQQQTTHERIEFMKPTELHKLFRAALKHDAETFAETREEHRSGKPVGTTARYQAIAPFVAFVLLTGMRLNEALAVTWDQVDLEALDNTGAIVGEIHIAGTRNKTKRARTVDLSVSPALRTMLIKMHEANGGHGSVFGVSRGEADTAMGRLRDEYGAPKRFSYQTLRRTCGTYLTNAPGIFGAASVFRSARQLGHSVKVAEQYYLGLVKGIPADAKTLEDALQLQELMTEVTASRGTGPTLRAKRKYVPRSSPHAAVSS